MGKIKKGLSPVIATVLLITMVIIIALIVFLWIKGMTEEAITKFGDRNIQLVCNDVSFEADYSGTSDTLSISNLGNVPIFGMKVKIVGAGSHTTEDLREDSNWPEVGLNTGGRFSDSISFDGDEIILIPVLMGNSEQGRKTYVCDEKQHGYKINI